MRRPPGRGRALWVLAVLGVGTVLYLARQAFVPIALAALFALILSSTVEWLHRHRIPRALSAVVILSVLLGALGTAGNALLTPAQHWLSSAPRVLQTIERRIRPAEGIVKRLQAVTAQAGSLAKAPAAAAAPAPAAPIFDAALLTATGATLTSAAACVILTIFLLSGGPPMLARMAASMSANLPAAHALRVIEAIRRELGRYYGTIALINLGLGVATGLAMLGLGLPNPVLWGALAALLNFVPYVGSATTLAVLTIVAFISFEELTRVLSVTGSYLALATLEGQVVQPLLVGRRLELNPILVFLAVWFAGWFWGVAGIVIAIPALVALKVAAEHGRDSGALLAFLGPVESKSLEAVRGRLGRVRERAARSGEVPHPAASRTAQGE
ncbi:MAG: AI-2E family transporter [Proteobacteria bacterium]|nr:AI-2E family transporter [Pseudomonadota bacterium]